MKTHCFSNSLLHCINMLNNENVIAYPTESMFGLGCDPDSEKAVKKLLHLKKRSIEKGLILVASNFNQIKMYINEKDLLNKHKKKFFFIGQDHLLFYFLQILTHLIG